MRAVAAGAILIIVGLAATGGLRLRNQLNHYEDRVVEAVAQLDEDASVETDRTGPTLCFLQCPDTYLSISAQIEPSVTCDDLAALMTEIDETHDAEGVANTPDPGTPGNPSCVLDVWLSSEKHHLLIAKLFHEPDAATIVFRAAAL